MILFIYALKYSELYYGPIQLKSGNDDSFSWTYLVPIFRRGRKIAKIKYELRLVCLSSRLHGKTRLPLDGFH